MLHVTSSRCGSTAPSQEANLGLFFQPVIISLMFVCEDRSDLGLEICYIKIARTETDSDHEGLRQHFFSEQGKVYQII